MEDFIKYLFDSTIDVVLKDFSNDEIDEVKKNYLEYLKLHYKGTIDEDQIEKAKQVFPGIEINNFKNLKKEEKQRLLLEDEALERLEYFSHYANTYALYRMDNDKCAISEEQANNYLVQMGKEFKKVRSFNKHIAENLLSESIVDFQYAAGLTNNMSLRSARR